MKASSPLIRLNSVAHSQYLLLAQKRSFNYYLFGRPISSL